VCACKPNSVCPRSRRPRGEVIIYLERPSPAVSSGLPAPCRDACRGRLAGRLHRHDRDFDRAGTVPLGLTPRGVCLADPVTGTAGALLPHPFTPYPDRAETEFRHRDGTALCCTCHLHRLRVRERDAVFPLGSTVPCGVRTFLTAAPDRSRNRRSDDRAHPTQGGKRAQAARSSGCALKAQSSRKSSTLVRRPRSFGAEGPFMQKSAAAQAAVCAFKGRPFPSSRRPSRCRDLRRR
jgi:hypothetical protein